MEDNRALIFAVGGIIIMSLIAPVALSPMTGTNYAPASNYITGRAASHPNPPSTACTDYDGTNYYTKSYVTYKGVTYWDGCTGTNINEMICAPDKKGTLVKSSTTFACPYGCSDGKCLPQPLYCGDNIIQAPNDAGFNEQCDRANLNNKTCTDFPGYNGGTLACKSDCTFDFSSCTVPYCGDGIIQVGEECEPSIPLQATCTSKGFTGGTLGCTNCRFDTTACYKQSCADSDYGINPPTAGTVSGIKADGSPYSYSDYCPSTYNLVEYYCSYTQPFFTWYNCTNFMNGTTVYLYSCENGACVYKGIQ